MSRQQLVIILLGIVAVVSLLRLVAAALHRDAAGRRGIRIPRPGEWDALTWLILPLPLLAGAGRWSVGAMEILFLSILGYFAAISTTRLVNRVIRKDESGWRVIPPRFGLRSLLVVTVVLCLIFAVVGTRMQEIERQRALGSKLEAKGSHVSYFGGDVSSVQPYGEFLDEDLSTLKEFPELELLFLQDARISDKGLEHIAQYPKLRWLVLSGRTITDAGIEHLAKCPSLTHLFLGGTAVTDACVANLAAIRTLTFVNIANTGITEEGLKRLASLRPDVEIER